MFINTRFIVREILNEYALDVDGVHGVTHWARVTDNGIKLSETTGANLDVVRLFALFHDSKRISDSSDPEHGKRGAEFAAELRGTGFEIPDHDFELLQRACIGHTHERTHPDITIQTCWDSDRLDLGRVGVIPNPSRLCTDVAKLKETIQWADGRAAFEIVPEWVTDEWGLHIKSGL